MAVDRRLTSDVDARKLKCVTENLSVFIHDTDTAAILPFLKPCLQHDHFMVITRMIEFKARYKVNHELWMYLKRGHLWWQYLEEALAEWGPQELLQALRKA